MILVDRAEKVDDLIPVPHPEEVCVPGVFGRGLE